MGDVMSAVAAAIVVTALTALTVGAEHGPQIRSLDVWGYLLVALAGATLLFRKVLPQSTFGVTLGLGLAYQAAGYPGGPAPLPIVLAVYTLAALGQRLRALGCGLLAAVLLVGVRGVAVRGGWDSPLLLIFPIAIVAALYAGQIPAQRAVRLMETARRTAEQAREQEQETHRRIEAERLRIARELHDVVAHNISLINVQATMGVHLMDERPAEAAAALTAIKQASKQALRELRRILDVLRQADEAEPTAPAPGLADLDAMIATTSRAGLPTALSVTGTPRPLPATVDVAAFRIIQESLTNALRYAGTAPTQINLRYGESALNVEVFDAGSAGGTPAAAGSGHGIAGMQERATAVGGTLHAGPNPGGGFTVHALLPLTSELS